MRVVLLVSFTMGCDEEKPEEDERFESTEPGDCTDLADNDADGLFDCDDDGCADTSALYECVSSCDENVEVALTFCVFGDHWECPTDMTRPDGCDDR
jgi:hypothetical protein